MEKVIQLPLPDVSHVPAWVSAALDSIHKENYHRTGLYAMLSHYPELEPAPGAIMHVERNALKRLQALALMWQSANFRLSITGLEKLVVDCERKLLSRAVSTKLVEQKIVDVDGEKMTIEAVVHDAAYITSEIQKMLRNHSVIMGYHQIWATLDRVSAIYAMCDYLDVAPKIVGKQPVLLRRELRHAA